jgi:signal peptidase I
MRAENQKIESKKALSEILQWFRAIIIALIVAIFIRGFLFEMVLVDGQSMENSLYDHQRLIVYKLGYNFSIPKRGDVIVFKYDDGALKNYPFIQNNALLSRLIPDFKEIDYIKRVIALPGEEVDIKDGAVYINGKKLEESYAKDVTDKLAMELPAKVPENKVFVLGDNRQNSNDSRSIGFIELDRVKGKAVLRVLPVQSFGNIYS